jgi:hypothetical protein
MDDDRLTEWHERDDRLFVEDQEAERIGLLFGCTPEEYDRRMGNALYYEQREREGGYE